MGDIVDQIHSLLLHGHGAGVQYNALCALPSVVARGDEKIMATLLSKAIDKNDMVRSAALYALGQVANRGDPQAMTCMIGGLKDSCINVRTAAMQSLHITSGGKYARTDGCDSSP